MTRTSTTALATVTEPTGKTLPLLADLPPASPTLTARAVRVLDGLEKAKEGQDENYRSFLDTVAREIRKAGDSPAVLADVLAILEKMKTPTAPKTPCDVHSWCVETGRHDEHMSACTSATCTDVYGREVLPVNVIDWGNGVKIGLLDEDLTPAEARGRIAELRAHLDAVEALVAAAEAGR
ncbi:hypothetical protein J7F03_28455 [Streptomyces sp. ISL-43]|uniref:hypothetical protein n=1 Tax=Streptomyces sp. ISL-43 TaxID=2819183 RepID=UPI001BED27C6|nr:hypothetical protein [Streptomyces sp. ISL-43]MBT2450937.1 hypothetical protein [Streptomyces sp. ISL-43]